MTSKTVQEDSLYAWGRLDPFKQARSQVSSPELLQTYVDSASCTPFHVKAMVQEVFVEGSGFLPLPATYISGGVAHTCALLDDGSVYSWGRRHTGHGRAAGDPAKLMEAGTTRAVACGDEHSIAVSRSGEVWVWGNGNNSRLGFPNSASVLLPRKLTSLDHVQVATVACGAHHSMVLTVSGDLWTWGANGDGQCGVGLLCNSITTPTFVPTNGSVLAIAGGGFHSLAVIGTKRRLFSWGSNSHGQLGVSGNQERCIVDPRRVSFELQVVHVAAGALHSAAVDTKGNLWSFGHGGYGQLGTGSIKHSYSPTLVPGLPSVKAVECGRWHSMALSGDPMELEGSRTITLSEQDSTNVFRNERCPQKNKVGDSIESFLRDPFFEINNAGKFPDKS